MAIVRWAGLWLVILGALLSPQLIERDGRSLAEVREALAQEASPTSEVSANPTPDFATATETATAEATPTQDATATETATEVATPVPDAETAIPPTETPAESATPSLETETPSVTPTPSHTATSTTIVEVIIGPDGGSVTTADGQITLTFPEGATKEPLQIRLQPKDRAKVPGLDGTKLLGLWDFDAYAVDRAYAPVNKFDGPVTVDVRYTSAQLFGVHEDLVRYWTLDDATQTWSELPVRLVGSYHWQAEITHFSTHATSSDTVLGLPPILEASQVNLNTGSSSFSFPLTTAPRIGAVVPQVALTYSSARVDESELGTAAPWAGVGWDLSMPSITRATDRFYLNLNGAGGELVKKTGTTDQWLTRDQQFLQITHNPSCDDSSSATLYTDGYACAWIVKDQTGRVWTFGGNAQSRRYYASVWGLGSFGGFRHYQWDLSSVTDTHGNTATYAYEQVKGIWSGCSGSENAWLAWVLSAYPTSITYPGGRVRFVQRTDNLTYSSSYGDPYYDPQQPTLRARVRPDVQHCYAYFAFETRVLSEVIAETWDTSGYATQASYSFMLDGLGAPDNYSCTQFPSVRLLSIASKGRDGGTLGTTTFEYTNKTQHKGALTKSDDYLTRIQNGFGGESLFAYNEVTATGYWSRYIATTMTNKAGTIWGTSNPDVVQSYAFSDGPHWVADGLEYSGGPTKYVYRGFKEAKVTDAATNYTKHYFYVGNETGAGIPTNVAQLAGREYKTERFEEKGATDQLWGRTESMYSSTANPTPTGTATAQAYQNTLDSVKSTAKESAPGANDGAQALTSYTYDRTSGHGQILEVREDGDTDTGNSNADCRKTVTTYYATPASLWLIVPESTKVRTCANVTASETFLYYDGTTGAPLASPNGRGNLTAVRRLTTTGTAPTGEQYIWTLSQYNTNGTPDQVSVPTYGDSTTPPLTTTNDPKGIVWNDKGRTQIQYEAASASRFPSSETVYVYDYTTAAAAVPTQVTTYTYDSNSRRLGVPKMVTAPTGLVAEGLYDEFGRPLKQWTAPEVSTGQPGTEYVYDWSATTVGVNKTTVKRRLTLDATVTMNTYHCADGLGRASQQAEPSGAVQHISITRFNNLGLAQNLQDGSLNNGYTCVPSFNYVGTAPNNYTEYDASNQASTFTNSAPGTPTPCAPACTKVIRKGRTTETIDQMLHKKDQTADGLGRVIQSREYTGTGTGPDPYVLYTTTTFAYDVLGNLTTVTDQNSNVTTITYDALGRKKTMDDPDMSGGNVPWLYAYDAAGNLTSQTDARLVNTTLKYDSLNRLRMKQYDTAVSTPSVVDPADVVLTYDQYDADTICTGLTAAHAIGKLTIMSDSSGTTRSCYDVRGREVRKRHVVQHAECTSGNTSRTLDVLRAYDTGDRPTTLTYPDGEVLTYGYKDVTSSQGGLLNSITSSLGDTVLASAGYQAATATPSTLTFGATPAAVATTTYTRDNRYRLQRISSIVNASTVQDLNYEYQENGNISRINDVTASDNVYYNYDPLDRLIDMRQGSPTGTILAQYAYAGAAGKIGNMTYKMEGGSGDLVTYGDPDHVHAVKKYNERTLSYDRNGNILAHGVDEYFTFDVESRLTRNADQTGFALQNDYTYDGQGNLVKRRMTSWLYPGLTDTKDVYADGIYEERSYDCGAPSSITKRYMAFGRMLATRNGSTLSYVLADHLSTTRGTVNASGGAVSTIAYWPFGATRSGTVGTDKQYTGQQKESVSTLGAYYYKARFYSTTTGSFLSADPITADGLNRYAYVRGNPLRYADPSGFCGEALIILFDTCTGEKPFYQPGDVGPVQAGAPCSALCIALSDLNSGGITGPADIEFRQGLLAAKAYDDLRVALVALAGTTTPDCACPNEHNADAEVMTVVVGGAVALSFADGPLPFADAVAVAGVGAVGCVVYCESAIRSGGAAIKAGAGGLVNWAKASKESGAQRSTDSVPTWAADEAREIGGRRPQEKGGSYAKRLMDSKWGPGWQGSPTRQGEFRGLKKAIDRGGFK